MICRRIGVGFKRHAWFKMGIVQNTQQYLRIQLKCEFIIVIKNRRSRIWTVITHTQSLRHFLMSGLSIFEDVQQL